MKTLPIFILLLLFFINSIDGIGQLTSKDSIKKLVEVHITGDQKDIERLPLLEGTRINAGKKNEVINLSALTADLSSNNYRQIMAKVPGVSIWENDGSGISIGNALLGSSRYRPIVYIVITAFNAEKKKVYSKTVSVRDFEKLQSFQYTVNGVTVRNAEVLQPQQIFEMLVKSLQELKARGKR